jgi:hypothetical protein
MFNILKNYKHLFQLVLLLTVDHTRQLAVATTQTCKARRGVLMAQKCVNFELETYRSLYLYL